MIRHAESPCVLEAVAYTRQHPESDENGWKVYEVTGRRYWLNGARISRDEYLANVDSLNAIRGSA